jgi:hypothetical protein
MTKICPNCKTENIDSAKFCKNCGNEMEETEKPTQTKKSPKNSSIGGNKQKNTSKTLGIIGVCCLGILVIVVVSGMLSPDKTFANQYVSFNLPSGYVAVNQPDNGNGFCDVNIYKGTPADSTSDTDPNYVGDISTVADSATDANMQATYSEDATTTQLTLNGVSATQFVDTDPSTGEYDLWVPSKRLLLSMYPDQGDAFNTIKNSIAFK